MRPALRFIIPIQQADSLFIYFQTFLETAVITDS
jgi:hypothetical protein